MTAEEILEKIEADLAQLDEQIRALKAAKATLHRDGSPRTSSRFRSSARRSTPPSPDGGQGHARQSGAWSDSPPATPNEGRAGSLSG